MKVVTAAGALAKRRIGAIIVIERDIGLRNYIESGIPLDSAVTYDLLISLFQPDAPLHDGAVILQENRVAAAACFLPLTREPAPDDGARHPPPRRDRPDGGVRCGGAGRLGGDRDGCRWPSTDSSSGASTPTGCGAGCWC